MNGRKASSLTNWDECQGSHREKDIRRSKFGRKVYEGEYILTDSALRNQKRKK